MRGGPDIDGELMARHVVPKRIAGADVRRIIFTAVRASTTESPAIHAARQALTTAARRAARPRTDARAMND